MDTNSRVSSNDLCNFSKRLLTCVDAKDLRQCRQGGSCHLRRSCATAIALIVNMLLLDANNNSQSERARRNWKRTYYCCYWIGVTSVSASSISPPMEADNNNNHNNIIRVDLPDVVQEVNRNGHLLVPLNQQNQVHGHNIQQGDLIEPAIFENDDSTRIGRQLRQVGDEFEENRVRGHQHPFRDALMNLVRLVFGIVFGNNFYGPA